MCSCCMSVKDLQHLQMMRSSHKQCIYLSPKTSKVHDCAWPAYIQDHSSVTHLGRFFAAHAKFIFYRKIIASLTSWAVEDWFHMRQPLGRVTETYWNMLKPSRDILGLWYCIMTCLWHGTRKKVSNFRYSATQIFCLTQGSTWQSSLLTDFTFPRGNSGHRSGCNDM